MSVKIASEWAPTGEVVDLSTIDAVLGASDVLNLLKPDGSYWSGLAIQATVALSTSTELVMRIEGSLDNESWLNLDDSGVDTTISEDGTSLFNFENDDFAPIRYVRVYMVSETGGTGATIVSKAMVGG